MSHPVDATGERRQLTAFFCDLVGSTELSTHLDLDDYFEVIRAYHERSAALVGRYGGYVAQYQGDGFLAYFGYPHAHEDATERAVRAGLAIVDALRELNLELERERNVRLSLRIGIHTGTVVLGETGEGTNRERLAMGETVNLAARLQAIAAADSIVISGDSERLVRGRFDTDDLGLQHLKGFSRPIAAYRVAGSTGVRGRLDGPGGGRLTPFIGREAPLRRLLEVWDRTRRGSGGVAVISGEPGIGKSRLARVLREKIAHDSPVWLEVQCSAWAENTAFYPVIDLQKRLLEIKDNHTPAQKLDRFAIALQQAGLAADEALPLIAALHAIPLPEHHQPPPLSREAQRRRTLETLREWLLHISDVQPAVLLVEDVQWIDPSSAELIAQLLEHVADHPLLLFFTHRPDAALPWSPNEAVTIRLDRLDEEEASRIVEGIARAEAFPRDRMVEIVARAEGVPLYLEELTKAVLESDSARASIAGSTEQKLPPSTIPATLRDSLMARLDRLGSAKELALLASAIGREFSYALLAAASTLEEHALRAQLARLLESELVFKTGEPPDATYRFKHALIRDEAYQSLIRSVRRQYHTQIGLALEARLSDEAAVRPELVGHHFLEAGDDDKGALYLTIAARRAVTASANVEAIRHAQRALEVLSNQPASPRRSTFELALWSLRGAASIAIRGYAAAEVQHAFERARELADTVGDNPQLVPALHGLWLYHMVRGDRDPTQKLADQLLAIAASSDDPTARLFALTVAGIQRFFEGHFQPAIDYIERAFALYDPQQHRQLAVTYSLGTAGVARVNAATCHWFLGRPDRARQLVREVVDAARAERHPFTLAGVCVMGSMVFRLCGDEGTVRALHEEALRIATEQGFPLWIGGAECGLGMSIADDDFEKGLHRIREGMALFRSTGARTNLAFVTGEVAGLCLSKGRLDEAEAAVDEALALVARHLEAFYAPELWRVKGELALARNGDERGAEQLFERALQLARAEDAKSLELRAATSLARLAERRGDRRKGVALLAPTYEWFTEGFDTHDLRTARALLDRLA